MGRSRDFAKYTSCALLTLVQTAANGSSPPLVSIDMNGPLRPLTMPSQCCGAARQTGLSLQPRNRVMGEFTQCGLS
jgi:hypothetical protein